MMSEEFKDYYNEILDSVKLITGDGVYAKSIVEDNFFRIKTGFYEDENPTNIINSIVFKINENKKKDRRLLVEGFFDTITNFFKGLNQKEDSADEINRYLQQIQDILDENQIFDEEITKLLGELRDSDYINLIDFSTTIRGLKNKFLKPGNKEDSIREFLQKLLISLPKRAEYEEKINQQSSDIVPEVVSTIKESLIIERSFTDQYVRDIVKSLTEIVKTRIEKTYYLPEDITNGEKFEYEIDGIPPFSIEFVYNLDEYLEGEYRLDGDYDKDDDVIEIRLTANPNFLPKLLYDLIGDLNDIVRHEMEHLFQNKRGELDDDGDVPKDKSYYLQPKELPAQIQGLRRIARLRKQPIDFVIRSWFQRNKPIHGLNDEDIEELTLYLSSLYDYKFKQ